MESITCILFIHKGKPKTVPKPTLVDKLNKQRLGQTPGKGTRQNSSVTSEEARPPAGVSLKRGRQLFIKNTGLCHVLSHCIGSDACPVLADKRFLCK